MKPNLKLHSKQKWLLDDGADPNWAPQFQVRIDPRALPDLPHLNNPASGPLTYYQMKILRELGYR